MEKMGKLRLEIDDLDSMTEKACLVADYLMELHGKKTEKYGKLHNKLVSIRQADSIVTKGEIDAIN